MLQVLQTWILHWWLEISFYVIFLFTDYVSLSSCWEFLTHFSGPKISGSCSKKQNVSKIVDELPPSPLKWNSRMHNEKIIANRSFKGCSYAIVMTIKWILILLKVKMFDKIESFRVIFNFCLKYLISPESQKRDFECDLLRFMFIGILLISVVHQHKIDTFK